MRAQVRVYAFLVFRQLDHPSLLPMSKSLPRLISALLHARARVCMCVGGGGGGGPYVEGYLLPS
jgi:hypothetical protein